MSILAGSSSVSNALTSGLLATRSTNIDLVRAHADGMLRPEWFSSARPPADNHEGQRDAEIATLEAEIDSLVRELLQVSHWGENQWVVEISERIAEKRDRLALVKTLDFLVNVARAAGVTDERAIDQLDNAQIEEVDDNAIDSDAAFVHEPPRIMVRHSVMERIRGLLGHMIKDGVVSDGGGVAWNVENDERFIEILNTISLIALHETTHASQASETALFERMEREFRNHVPWLQAIEKLPNMIAKPIRNFIAQDLLASYIDIFEYDAYAVQERFLWKEYMKVAPEFAASKRWLTVDGKTGEFLDRAQAVTNIRTFINEVEPGYAREFLAQAMTSGWEDGGPRWLPGWRSPGWRSPGHLLPIE